MPDICKDQKELEITDDEFGYWRKNYTLQRWMNDLAVKKGFKEDAGDFNCVMVRLKKEDIKELKKGVKSWRYGSGEYFDEEWFEQDKKNTLKFCKKALEAIDDGYAVYYDSWW